MKNFLLRGLVLALIPFGLIMAAAPAQASCTLFQCGDFAHINDDGYDEPIPVTCDWNLPWSNVRYIAEHQSSQCHDTDGFYVTQGKTVSCLFHGDGYGWVTYTNVGWHKINDGQNLECVHGLA